MFSYFKNRATDSRFSASTNSPKIGLKSNSPLLESATAISDMDSFTWVNSSGEIAIDPSGIEYSRLTPPPIGSATNTANTSRLPEPRVITSNKIKVELIHILDIRTKVITERSQTIGRLHKLIEAYSTKRIQEILDVFLEKKNTCQESDTIKTASMLTENMLKKICSAALIKARELTGMINNPSITNDLKQDVLSDELAIKTTKEYIQNLDSQTHTLRILSKTASILFMNAESWNRATTDHGNDTSLSNRISFLEAVDKELDTIIARRAIVDTCPDKYTSNLEDAAEKLIKKLIEDNAEPRQKSGMVHSVTATTTLSDIQHETVVHRSNTCSVFNFP